MKSLSSTAHDTRIWTLLVHFLLEENTSPTDNNVEARLDFCSSSLLHQSMQVLKITHRLITGSTRIHTYSRKEVSTYLPASILKSGVVSDMTFAVQQKNIDELTNILYDISDPDSPNYGQHWSNDEVSEFTSNPEGLDVVVSYLNSNGPSVVSETRTGEYITARAPIRV